MNDAVETPEVPGKKNELSIEPQDTDQGSNTYVVTYLTRKHGPTGKEVSFDYGTNLDVPPEDLAQGSFNGIGDNMMWSSVYWRFTLEGTPVVLHTTLNSATRSAGTSQIVEPRQPLHLPNGSVLTPTMALSLGSAPFDENNILRKASELSRDSHGQIIFLDVSDDKGEDAKSAQVLQHLKASGSVAAFADGAGPEFEKFNNIRYAGPGGHLMRPDGMADQLATRKAKEVLAKKGTEPAKPDTTSVFQPQGEEEGARFAGKLTDPLDSTQTQQSTESIKGLTKAVNELKDTLKSASYDDVFIQSICQGHFVKRASLLKRNPS